MADPGATSPALQTATSGIPQPLGGLRRLVGVAAEAGVELAGDRGAQAVRTGAERQAVDGVLEEAEHDEALGDVGRNAARLEVVELIPVDRADGRGVRAADVVGLDLEVGDRL